MLVDFLVHQRLGKARFVPFVVTVATVPDQVNEKIFIEFVAVSKGSQGCFEAAVRVVGVYVDDRDFKSFRQVAGMQGAPSFFWIGRIAKLVVRDDMDRTGDGIAFQVREVEGLGDNPLGRKGSVSMD